jgi:hypothetical protein
VRTRFGRCPLLRHSLFIVPLLIFGCTDKKEDAMSDSGSECPFDGTYDTVEEFGAEVVPIYCGYKIRCHELGPGSTYEGCVEGYLESAYVSEECQWDRDWSCQAAQCISEWRAQEEYLQISDPECLNKPDPWRPESCSELYRSMECVWSDGV